MSLRDQLFAVCTEAAGSTRAWWNSPTISNQENALGTQPALHRLRRKVIMNELTKEQADALRRTAEYLTLQMRLSPHPTERSRIRAMADTVDFVAERID